MPASSESRCPVRLTTIIEAPRLTARLGINLFLASETFQETGSFKFRAAYHVVSHISQDRVIAASSGNFGQAMARACQLLNKSCVIVMPKTSAQVKVEAVREFGGAVDLIDTQVKSRQARVEELAASDPGAYVASPYDDPLVISGNASLGAELASLGRPLDLVLAPVGGGGLTSGLVQGLRSRQSPARVIGVEPAMADDAARSLKAGRLIANESEPKTLADGARTLSLGRHNWEILKDGLLEILEVSEAQIEEALRLLFLLANLKAEPTGALSLAALMASPQTFRGRSVCCVISGGNVDPELFCRIVKGLPKQARALNA
jgi:threonine dehydratase